MPEKSPSHTRDDVDQQFQIIRDDITTLTNLLRDIGEEKVGEKRDAAIAEAAELLEKSRAAIDDGRLRATQATASIEDYIHKQPVQSALIALGVGFLFGMITRR
ncbi:DUF883 family protein [Marivita sp.]|uniref:DUF883 family protein n=1 Tax=Marivita sp. TaxID=2003365 RepID=UPI003F6C126B